MYTHFLLSQSNYNVDMHYIYWGYALQQHYFRHKVDYSFGYSFIRAYYTDDINIDFSHLFLEAYYLLSIDKCAASYYYFFVSDIDACMLYFLIEISIIFTHMLSLVDMSYTLEYIKHC